MAAWLATQGYLVNRKRVRRLMRLMGLVAIYQRPNTSKAAVAHKVYPYLLGGIAIERVNQVWCSDVTYMSNGTQKGPRLGIDGLGQEVEQGAGLFLGKVKLRRALVADREPRREAGLSPFMTMV
jgi:transposase InsO family protein